MKKTIIPLLVATLALSNTQAAEKKEVTQKKETTKKEQAAQLSYEDIIRKVMKPLERRGISIKKVYQAKDVYALPGYKAFVIDLIDKGRNAEVKEYIWISEDKNHAIFDIFDVVPINNTVSLKPIRPKDNFKPIKSDLSWLKDIDDKMNKLNIPHVFGKGNKKIYIAWDVYCPFCYKHFEELTKKAKELNVEIHMLPLAIHGDRSLKGFVYYTELARKKGAEETFKYLYSLGNGDFQKYATSFKKEAEKGLRSISDKEKKELEKFFQDLKRKLISEGVRATPSIVYETDPKTHKGYVIKGFKPLEEVIKMK